MHVIFEHYTLSTLVGEQLHSFHNADARVPARGQQHLLLLGEGIWGGVTWHSS